MTTPRKPNANPHARALQALSAKSGLGQEARRKAASRAGKASQSPEARAKRRATIKRRASKRMKEGA